MNHVALTGWTATDAKLYYVGESETPLARFRLAVKRGYRNGESGRDQADFFTVKIWGDAAERLAPFLKKGRRVAVNGELRIENYEARDGDMRTDVEVVSRGVEFLDSFTDDDESPSGGASEGASPARKRASDDGPDSVFEEELDDDGESDEEDDRYVPKAEDETSGASGHISKTVSQESPGAQKDSVKARASNRFTSFKKTSKSAPF